MIKHLAECAGGMEFAPGHWWCICKELRACQERVLREAGDRWVAGMATEAVERWRAEGYAQGLNDAGKAIAKLQTWQEFSWGLDTSGDGDYFRRDDVMAAVSALRDDT